MSSYEHRPVNGARTPKIVLDLWAYNAPNSGMNDATVIDRAADTITELLEALEFYADRDFDGYDVQVTNYGLSTEEGEIIRDRGERARAAIAKARGQA